MNVLFLCIPGRGRLEVLSPLAAAFAAAGHDVRFAAPEGFAPLVRSAGFDALVAGLDVPEMKRVMQARGAPAEGTHSVSSHAVAMFTEVFPESLLADLMPALREWPPALVVHEEGEFTAPLVAAQLGVPCVTVGWPVAMKPLDVLERVTQPLEALWRRHGRAAPAWGGLYRHFVDTCPPTLQSAAAATWGGALSMRPETAPAAAPMSDAELGIDDSGRPVVHVTLGTVDAYNNAPDLLERLLQALADEPVQIVLTTGEALGATDLARPANVTARTFLPHGQLLPRCDLVICHGGAGSTIAALAHGLPLLIVPRGGASQYRNAVQCARVGCGIHLAEAEVTATSVRESVRALLGQAVYRQTAERLRDEIRRMPPPAELVAPLAALAVPG